jgi:hypothetical protein
VNDLQEQLTSSWVEDKDGTIDWFGGQVTFESLVDGNSVHVGVIYEPDDLVSKELSIVLRV